MKPAVRVCAILLGAMGIAAVDRSPVVAQTMPSANAAPDATTDDFPPSATQPSATRIAVNFKDAPIDSVLDYLSQTAGFIIIKDVTGPLNGRITILSKQPMSPDEIIKDLNSILKTDGNTAIQMGRILKITSLANAKHANIPVHIGNDPSQIAETDELITQIIPVKSVDAVKLKTDLQPLVSPDADLTANAASNSLIITDSSANVRRVVEIVSNLDKNESAASAIRVWQLKYADATSAAKLITDIFNPSQDNGQNGGLSPQFQFIRAIQRRGGFGGGGFGGGGAPGGGGATGSADEDQTAAGGHIQASADTRTNTVVVSGPPDTLEIIDNVLKQLDANPASEQTFFIYRVKNGQAVDMAATLNGLFSQNGNTSNTSSTANRSTFNSSTGNRNSNSGGFGGSSGGGGLAGGGGGGLGGGSGGLGGGGGGSSQFGSNTRTQNGTANGLQSRTSVATGGGGSTASPSGVAGVSDLVGQVYVVADQDTNQLLVATATKYETQVRQVIDELDRRVPQVLIKVLIAQVTHNNSLALGTDFSVLNLNATANGPHVSNSVGANLAVAGAAAAGGPPGMIATLLEDNVTVTLQALAQAGKVDVLSRPYILTSDNQEADITVGSEVPFITNTTVDVNGGVHNDATYQDIGIILTVTPHINPEGLVTMEVSPQISSLTQQTVTIQAGVALPVFDVTSADAYLTVRDGQTVVIGGLMQDQNTESVSKFPLLGDIPLLGKLLFSYTSQSKEKNELLIFLTPHVALEPDLLKPMSEDEMRGLKLVPNAVEPGTFQEQMRGMQRGGSSTQPATATVQPTQHESLISPPLPGGN